MRLETSRLIIREFETSDWPAVHRYGSNIEIMKYVRYQANTEEDTKGFIQRVISCAAHIPRISYEWAVTLRETPETLIGGCGIKREHETHCEWPVGYCYHSEYWGRGYGTEVCRALIGYGFADLGGHRIYAVCDVDNKASARVLEKGGMRLEGCFREKKCGLGRWRDRFEYAILDHEWQAAFPEHPSETI